MDPTTLGGPVACSQVWSSCSHFSGPMDWTLEHYVQPPIDPCLEPMPNMFNGVDVW
jgi:hypothetical protein